MKVRLNLRILKAVAAILAFGTVCLGGLLALNRWETHGAQKAPDAPYSDDTGEDLVYFEGDWYRPREHLETVLLIGLDQFEGTTGNVFGDYRQSDFLLLVVIDSKQNECTAIHLNRDTMTDIGIIGVTGEPAGSFVGQLALAHTYGSGGADSCRNVTAAVSKLLYGAEIDHYISMTMDEVALLNDLAGGVTLEIMDDFSEIDPALVQGETVTLMGQRALTYVRARKGLEDSSNLRRMERQRQYLYGLYEQVNLRAEQDADFILEALLMAEEYLVSDCTVEQLSTLSETVQKSDSITYLTLPGEAVRGDEFMEFYVEESLLQSMVVDVFYEPAENRRD